MSAPITRGRRPSAARRQKGDFEGRGVWRHWVAAVASVTMTGQPLPVSSSGECQEHQSGADAASERLRLMGERTSAETAGCAVPELSLTQESSAAEAAATAAYVTSEGPGGLPAFPPGGQGAAGVQLAEIPNTQIEVGDRNGQPSPSFQVEVVSGDDEDWPPVSTMVTATTTVPSDNDGSEQVTTITVQRRTFAQWLTFLLVEEIATTLIVAFVFFPLCAALGWGLPLAVKREMRNAQKFALKPVGQKVKGFRHIYRFYRRRKRAARYKDFTGSCPECLSPTPHRPTGRSLSWSSGFSSHSCEVPAIASPSTGDLPLTSGPTDDARRSHETSSKVGRMPHDE